MSIKYFDASGNPVLYANDYAEIRYTYDLAGRETSVSYYDRGGSLKARRLGYAKKTTAYNSLGNVTEIAYFDTEGNLTNTTMNYAFVEYTYDELGNMTSEKYMDTFALGVIPEGSLYSYSLIDYDEKSRIISEEYYDDFDDLAPCREGYAAHYISYTESGLVAEEYYLDSHRKPISIDGFSRRELVEENAQEQTYVMRIADETMDEDAFIYRIEKYDHYGRPIETNYYDKNGNAAIGAEGCSRVIREFTSRSQISLEKYFDAAGNAAQVKGSFGISKEYTPFGKLAKETWLDVKGDPAANADGYASVLYDYDLSESSRVEKYFLYYLDASGNRCAAANGAWGISTLYYPVTLVHEITFLDGDGNPIVTADGYAIKEYEQDENGNVTWEGYFDAIHAQINCLDGYASVERGYDSEGRLISERYLNRYNKLTNNKSGVAGWNGYYDSDGILVITNRYDENRNALPLGNQ
ncbi:MAG: hypothetical protein IKP72_02360 [Clostridia bacterium]|nr:hypothetical protein [Clostridia bacterium]